MSGSRETNIDINLLGEQIANLTMDEAKELYKYLIHTDGNHGAGVGALLLKSVGQAWAEVEADAAAAARALSRRPMSDASYEQFRRNNNFGCFDPEQEL